MRGQDILSHGTEQPDVSVVIVNYNTAHLLDRMFAALAAGRGDLRLQIIVVDNASRDNSVEVLRTRHPGVELIENAVNVGFARANNQAVTLASGRYVLLLNTDAFVSADTLPKTVSFMDAHTSCGVLGVKLVGEDGSLQPCCRYFPTPWNRFILSNRLGNMLGRLLTPNVRHVDDMSWNHASVRECDWVPGCYYLVRREVIDCVGLFDPRYFLYCEEVDHCRAVRKAGWSVTFYPFTQVVHSGGKSAEAAGGLDEVGQIPELQIESELLYFRKHYGFWGMLSGVALALLGDVIRACGARQKPARTAASLKRVRTTLRLLLATRFASRATR